MTTTVCPCGSTENYHQCCSCFHLGESIPSAPEQLMRSRYSAFVMGEEEYLLQTWHATTRPEKLDLQDGIQWVGLKIKDSGLDSDDQGWVEFVAHFRLGGQSRLLQEKSRFVREKGIWYYLDGQITEQSQKTGRNAPCICGSGKKYKRCCG